MATKPTVKYEEIIVAVDFDSNGTVDDAAVISKDDIHYYDYVLKLKIPTYLKKAIIKEVTVK